MKDSYDKSVVLIIDILITKVTMLGLINELGERFIAYVYGKSSSTRVTTLP